MVTVYYFCGTLQAYACTGSSLLYISLNRTDLFQNPTLLQRVHSRAAQEAQVQWFIKRDDLIHPQISGNKWRKLIYNFLNAVDKGYTRLLTFGGAYSNHLYAVAAAGKRAGVQTIGIVRGERPTSLSPTLQFAESCGMHLEFWSREAYALKDQSPVFQEIESRYAPFYLIPEGGSNALAVKGCTEIVAELTQPFDYLCCACGTGGTLAGLIAGAAGQGQVLGFSALKGGEFLVEEVRQLLNAYYLYEYPSETGVSVPENWHIETGYHFGGYAKHTPDLLNFIRRFERENAFLIEQVYTAKMLWGIEDLLRKDFFQPSKTIVSIHTGGLQGRLPELDMPI